jgi:hypothetical protein
MSPRAYIVRPAVFVPVVLSAFAIVVAAWVSWWFLVAVPFVWLGSICAQPNLNLADGCLAYVTIIVGLAVLPFFRPVGLAIVVGTISGLYASAVEKGIRMRPAPDA